MEVGGMHWRNRVVALERCETAARALAKRPGQGGVYPGEMHGGEGASETAASGWPSKMERKLRPSSRSTDLAGGERFSAASARASIAMARGKGFQRHPLPLALPHPGWKSGTFYLAKKRDFLLCVDTRT